MFGFYNMVLRVILPQQSFELKMISDQTLYGTLGGKGLAAHLLRESKPYQPSSPLPEDNLIFATGPVTGNTVPGCLCCGAFTRSPQTGGCAAHYYCGKIAECMAGTGFDAVIVNGASDRPVWLEVCEGGSFFHSASELQGLEPLQTTKWIDEWMRENQPAARNLGVVCFGDDSGRDSQPRMPGNDFWSFEKRTDMGDFLQPRNVKAVVFWGGKERVLADPGLIERFASQVRSGVRMEDRSASSDTKKATRSKRSEESEPELECLSTIYDSLIVGDSYRHMYGWEDLKLLIKGATGLELEKEALRSIARSVMEDIKSLMGEIEET